MSEAPKLLRSATEAIWTLPPSGLEALSAMHRPPSGDLPKRLYANFDAYWLAGILYQLREMCGDEALDRGTLARIAGRTAEIAASRLRTWGLDEAAGTVAFAAGELSASKSTNALRDILSELVVFIDRIHVWIDSTIPWAAMGDMTPARIPRIEQ